MKLLKNRAPKTVTEPENNAEAGKKERVGKPMLLPIVFCLVSGVLLILLEDLTIKITGYVLAAALILQGIWLGIRYLRSEPMVRIVEARLAIGLIAVVTGALLAFNPETLREVLPFAWGLALLFGGFLKIQYAFDRKALGAEKWWILLILSGVSIAIGVISLMNPAFLGNRKEMVIGIMLAFEAALDFGVFLLLKRKIRKRAVSAEETAETIQNSEFRIQNEKNQEPEKGTEDAETAPEEPETEA